MGKIDKRKLAVIIRWTARIYGTLVLAIPILALIPLIIQSNSGNMPFAFDWRAIVLYVGLIGGLSIAYKWEFIGGLIATLGIIISGFLHPLIIPPGILYMISWFMRRSLNDPGSSGSQ